MEPEPVAMIVEALAVGAAAGGKAATTSAIKDAYSGLKQLLMKRFIDRPSGRTALEKYETKPEAWRGALEAELSEASMGADQDVVAAAERLIKALPESERIKIIDSSHFQIGNRNIQINKSEYRPDG